MKTKPQRRTALELLYRGRCSPGQGVLFLNLGYLISICNPREPIERFMSMVARPGDSNYSHSHEPLWHPPAAEAILDILAEHAPRTVITSFWLESFLLGRDGLCELLRMTGLAPLADSLHTFYEAPYLRGMTRRVSIERWLSHHYESGPVVVLDDELGGKALRRSRLDRAGLVVLCEYNVGLHKGHLPQVRQALGAARE